MKNKYFYLGIAAICSFIGCASLQPLVVIPMLVVSIISVGIFLELDNVK